jgi:hypothetical protein
MKRSAYAKLLALAVIEVVLIALLFLPVQTHAVKLDLPRGAAPSRVESPVVGVEVFDVIAVMVIVIAAVAIALWAVRIARRARAAARIPDTFS